MPQLSIIGAIKVIIFVASIIYSRQQANKIKKSLRSLGNTQGEAQGRLQTRRDSAAYKQVIYGECRVGGTIILNHNNGPKNEVKHMVIEIADHEVDSISQVQIDNETVQIDGGGNVIGRYFGYVKIWMYKSETEKEALYKLVENASDVWDYAHALTGTAGMYVKMTYKEDLFPNGIPNFTALVKGKKVYDPRTNLTAWSANPALCMADYYCDQKRGLGMDYDSEIDIDELIASANVCDEPVADKLGVLHPRYSCNGAFTCETVHNDVLNHLKAAMAGFTIDPPGRVAIIAGYWRPATLPAFDEGTLVSGLSVTTKIPIAENFNRVKGMYISPENSWQATDYPPVKNAYYLAEDNNRESWREINYTFVTSAFQAQRLGKIALEETRQGITVRGVGNFAWFQVRAGDVVKLNNTRRGWVNKEFFVEEIAIESPDSGLVQFPFALRETAQGVYDWNNGDETTVDLAPNTNLPSPFNVAPPTNLTALCDNTTREYDAENDQYIPRILVTWTAPADPFVLTVRLQYKKVTDTQWKDWAPVDVSVTRDYIFPVVQTTAYVVRARSETRMVKSAWVYSDPTVGGTDTTPPAAPTSFTASSGVAGIRLNWTNPADADLAFIEVYEHTASTPAPTAPSLPLVSVGDDDLNGTIDSTYFRSGLPAGVTRYYWIRAVDTSNNKSAWVGPRAAATVTPFAVNASPSSIAETHMGSGYAETSGCVAVVSGGIAPYSFQWEVWNGSSWENAVEGSTPNALEVSNPISQNVFWKVDAVLSIGHYAGSYRCKATDAVGQEAFSNTVEVDLNVTSL